ncbi:hypothetical protein GAMM_230011 [Gammaproteobacteria bacterium]
MEQLFNKFSDLKALEKEKARILGLFGEIKTGIKELSSLGIKIESSKSIKEASASIKLYQAEIKKLEAAQKQYQITEQRIIDLKIKESKAAEMAARATAAEVKVSNEVTRGKILETKERLANATAAEKEATALSKTTGSKAANTKLAQRPIESIPYTIIANNDVENLKKAGTVVSELDIAQAKAANSATAMAAAQVGVAKTTLVEGRELKGLTIARLAGAKTEKEAIENNKQLLAIRKQVNVTTESGQKKVLLINEAMNQNNRLITSNSNLLQVQKNNVGNYAAAAESSTSRILKATRGAFGHIRRLAFILPGIGIAGIFNLAFVGIEKLFSSIGSLFASTGKKISDFAQKQKTLGEISEAAAKGLGKEYAQLELIKAKLNDTNIPVVERLRLATEYNKTAEAANQIDRKQINNLTLINQSINDQIELIKRRALARASEAIIGDKAEAYLLAQEKSRQKNLQFSIQATTPIEGIATEQFINVGGKLIKYSVGSEAAIADQIASQKRFLAKAIEKDPKVIAAKRELESALEIGATLTSADSLFGKPEKPKKSPKGHDDLSDLFKNEQEKRKVLFEVQKRIIQDNLDADSIIIDNEKKSWDERLAAARDFYDQSLLLIMKEKEFELGNLDYQEEEEKRKTKNKKVLQSITEEYAAKRLLVETNTNSAILKLDEETGKKQGEIAKYSIDFVIKEKERLEREYDAHSKSIHENNLQEIKNQYDGDLLLLEEKFNRGEIKEKDYNKKRLRLIQALNIALLEEDIRFTKETLTLAEIRALASGKQEDIDAVMTAKSKLAGLEISLATFVADFLKDKNKETVEDFQETFEKIAEIARFVFDLMSGFAGAFYDKQKNAVQDQIDILDEQEQREIEIANQSILNEQDKAAKIDSIHRLAEARKQVLELKQRRLDQERARFEKAASIASIVLNTAVAVSKFLSKGNVLEAIIAGVMGAAQLAVAIATPIPHFATGKDKANKYEGKALVAEKGREFRVDSDGKMRLYEKPAIIDIGRNDQILTNQVTEAMLRSTGNTTKFIVAATNNKKDEQLNKVVDLLSDIRKKTGITLYNEHGIETSAWFNQHIRN